MELALIDSAGEVHTITEGIEEYDLDKPMARSSVIEDIQDAIKRALERRK